MTLKRRTFLKKSMTYGVGMGALGSLSPLLSNGKAMAAPFFKISLAQWSLHKTLFNKKLDNLDFAAKTKKDFGISAVEYVNQFFKDKAKDKSYLGEMKKRAADNGVESVLIMVDGEGHLGSTDDSKRKQAVENHYKWVEAAKFLGCHSIRVNAAGQGSAEEVANAAVDGLGSLAEFAKDFNINVIVENHGGYSSNGAWLSGVISKVNLPTCGTLPDFGNFCISRKAGKCVDEYDRYKGTVELMPFAKGVSAKTHDFDENGNEIHTDFTKMLNIVKKAGYTGYIGVEYEGSKMSEDEGIMATKKLLEKVGKSL
ncbi:sugar phosphate isomerase/epimerase family protein [Fulvivirgaceae bacterium BMA12]|uniref:Sugar phosphate isomerase/epimerase family protein n=1 Tax=Agaribacillus aureus TaxID=3051825 RepID=A0ABT8L724_9BACT|nr:sugar phosphate isomerase/epimerase family protein [Fulvivirgaceae bacterium BMA12]